MTWIDQRRKYVQKRELPNKNDISHIIIIATEPKAIELLPSFLNGLKVKIPL
jgi:hypothetical protein